MLAKSDTVIESVLLLTLLSRNMYNRLQYNLKKAILTSYFFDIFMVIY